MAIQPRGLRELAGLRQRLGEHDEDAGEGEDVLGQQGDDVGARG